jgi:hypothetical protein
MLAVGKVIDAFPERGDNDALIEGRTNRRGSGGAICE